MRILNISDGFASSTAPTLSGVTGVTGLKTYANDAAFVTDKGSSAGEGDIYGNTTDHTIHYYNGSNWISVGSSIITGSLASPQLISPGVSLPIIAAAPKQTIFIAGSGGVIDLTNVNPQIQVGTNVGDELLLICTSASNTVRISDGNGVSQNGVITMGNLWGIKYLWNGSVWWEQFRRENT